MQLAVKLFCLETFMVYGSLTHGTAIACSIASCSGEPYSTKNHLFTINGASATCKCNIYDDVHALSSSHRLLAHSTMLSSLHNLNLCVINNWRIAEKLNYDKVTGDS